MTECYPYRCRSFQLPVNRSQKNRRRPHRWYSLTRGHFTHALLASPSTLPGGWRLYIMDIEQRLWFTASMHLLYIKSHHCFINSLTFVSVNLIFGIMNLFIWAIYFRIERDNLTLSGFFLQEIRVCICYFLFVIHVILFIFTLFILCKQ